MFKIDSKIHHWVLCLFLLTTLGCKKFVEISPPTTSILTSNVFASQDAATAAQTAIYTGMEVQPESYNIAVQDGMLADELTSHSTEKSYEEYYTNSMAATDISEPWKDAYNFIYQANAVINGLQNYSGIAAIATQQLTGEAMFIRAFWYFYLTECYGAVPLATTPNYSINALLSRAPQSQVYGQIIADLKSAETLLNSNYVDATDTTIATDRVRPNKSAAAALLARTYLFAGYYDSAEQQASAVINNTTLYQLCPSLDTVFLNISPEAIWQIPPVQPSSNFATPDGRYFILRSAPQSGYDNTTTISPQLLSAFENGDKRMMHWINQYTHGTSNYFFPYKYKAYSVSSGSAVLEYTMVLRLAEQYLIRAEARAQQGNIAGALADLNVIRNRAGLPNYSGSMDQSSILVAILHERQVELFTEWGARWFDLQRTNTINSVMNVVAPQKGGNWNSSYALYPIPLTELMNDPKLTQNPNY
jgi:hypothetical protein